MARGEATFDVTGAYRYRLSRVWDGELPRVCWVMLNPSIATASVDDPTISRVMAFSRSWGFGSLSVVNLFALRTTRPRGLRRAPDPVGPENDATIHAMAESSHQVIKAWGNSGRLQNPTTGLPRSVEVEELLADAGVTGLCLGRTMVGEPRHPLYVAGSTLPVRA